MKRIATYLILSVLITGITSCKELDKKLLDAAREGDLSFIKENINKLKGKKNYSIDDYKFYFFTEAIKNNKYNVTDYLIEKQGVNINKYEFIRNLLFDLVFDNNKDAVKYLINKGLDISVVNTKDRFMKSSILCGAMFKNENEFVKYLISKGADVNIKDHNGDSPLHIALKKGNFEMVKYLVSKGADVNAKGAINNTPLHYAAEKNFLGIVKYLIDEKDADYTLENNEKATSFIKAVCAGSLDVVKYFVEEKKVDYNKKYDYPLFYRITPLHFAAIYGRVNILRYLCSKNADIFSKVEVIYPASSIGHNYPIHEAIRLGKLQAVKFFIEEKDMDVNTMNDFGFSCLHLAVIYGQPEIVKYLLNMKADVNLGVADDYGKKVKKGDTALDLIDNDLILGNGTFPTHTKKENEKIKKEMKEFLEKYAEGN